VWVGTILWEKVKRVLMWLLVGVSLVLIYHFSTNIWSTNLIRKPTVTHSSNLKFELFFQQYSLVKFSPHGVKIRSLFNDFTVIFNLVRLKSPPIEILLETLKMIELVIDAN
jgi:hypothetical protein